MVEEKGLPFSLYKDIEEGTTVSSPSGHPPVSRYLPSVHVPTSVCVSLETNKIKNLTGVKLSMSKVAHKTMWQVNAKVDPSQHSNSSALLTLLAPYRFQQSRCHVAYNTATTSTHFGSGTVESSKCASVPSSNDILGCRSKDTIAWCVEGPSRRRQGVRCFQK